MTNASWSGMVVVVQAASQSLRIFAVRASVKHGFVLAAFLLLLVFAASSVAQSPSTTTEASTGSEQPSASEDSETTLPGVLGVLGVLGVPGVPGATLPGAGGREVEVLQLMELYEDTKQDRSVSWQRRTERLKQLADRAWQDHLRIEPTEPGPSDFTALPPTWQLAGEVASNLNETRRAQLRERYLGIVGQQLDALTQWDGEEVERLNIVLSELRSESSDRAEIVAYWINASDRLRETDSDTLRGLSYWLRSFRAGSPATTQAHQRVVAEVERRLERAAGGEQGDEVGLFNLTGWVIASLPEKQRDPLRDRLMRDFVEDRQRLGGLSLRAVIELNLVLFRTCTKSPVPADRPV